MFRKYTRKSRMKNSTKTTRNEKITRRRRSLPQSRPLLTKSGLRMSAGAKSVDLLIDLDDSSRGDEESISTSANTPVSTPLERKDTVLTIQKSIRNRDWDKASDLLIHTSNAVDINSYVKDVGKRDANGRNMLHIALMNRSPLNVLQAIVQIGGREMLFEKENEAGNSPLMVATDYNSKFEVISWLVRMGKEKSVWQKNKFGFTPLSMACSCGASLQTVEEIVSMGGRGLVMDINDKGHTSLHLACSTSNSKASLAVVKVLIDNGGVDLVKKEGQDGRNALHLSYMNGAPIEVIQLLLNVGGADMLFQKNKAGYNHLQLACFNQNYEAIKTFVRLGGRELILSCSDEKNPLIISCTYGTKLEVVEEMVFVGGRQLVMKLNENGENVLHLICSSSATPANVLNFLAQMGGETLIFSKNGQGYNPLHLLCMEEGNIEMIKVLLRIAGNRLALEKDTPNGYNPLHILARNNPSVEAVKLLLNEGDSEILMQQDSKGNNPLHLACNFLGVELITIFVQKSNLEVITCMNDGKNATPLDILLKKAKPSLDKMQPLQKFWFELDPSSESVPTLTNANILIWARQLSESDLQRALDYGLIKSIMNKNFIKPVNIALLMTDLYIQLAIVVVYAFLIHPTITGQAGSALPRNILFICFAWSAFREITEMFRVRTTLKYADLVQLVLIMWTTLLFDGGGVSQTERVVYTLATGVSVLKLLIVLGNLSYPIAVFIIALLRIFWILVPFLVSTFLIVLSFAHMFYMWSISSLDICRAEKADGLDVPVMDWTCNLSSSYAQTFSILITSNWSFLDDEAEGFQTIISYAFAFIVGILLLNVLIAIINNEYNTTERNGDVEYWRYRLNFEDETQRIYLNFRGVIRPLRYVATDGSRILLKKIKRFYRDGNKKKDDRTPIKLFPKRGLQRKASLRDYFFTKDLEETPNKSFNQISFNTYSSADFNFENVAMGIKYNAEGSGLVFVFVQLLNYLVMLLNSIIIIGIFLSGLLTFGLCWPKKLKQKLFFGPTLTKNTQMSEMKSEMDAKIAVIQEDVTDVRASMEKISNTQEELMKALLANQAQVSELLTLLKAP